MGIKEENFTIIYAYNCLYLWFLNGFENLCFIMIVKAYYYRM